MESELLAKDKAIVVPGQAVASGMEYLPGIGTYRYDDKILVKRTGVLRVDGKVLKIMALEGQYLPNVDDVVIGKVFDILMSGWRLEINSPYSAVLPLQEASFDFIKKGADLTEYFDLGDYVACRVTQVTSQNLIDVSMKSRELRKLKGGYFVSISPNKVPRVIGRKGSMVGMIKQATSCEIVVGQNGIVWISGEPTNERIAREAIKMINEKAHVPGLTDMVKAFLEGQTGKKSSAVPAKEDNETSDGEKQPPKEESFKR